MVSEPQINAFLEVLSSEIRSYYVSSTDLPVPKRNTS